LERATRRDGGIVYTKPAIAWAGDSVALVAADTAGSLTYWWQTKNTTPWNRQIIDTAHQPAITGAPNNSASIAAVDPEGLRYWWRITDQQFSNPSTVSSLQQGTYSQPAIAWGDGTAVIAAVDNAGSLHYWWGNAEIWNPQVVAIMIGGFGYSQPSNAWADGAVVITAVDSAGNLDYWWQPEGSSGWTAAGGERGQGSRQVRLSRDCVDRRSRGDRSQELQYQGLSPRNQLLVAGTGRFGLEPADRCNV
jgi:hypothetical protein